MNKGDKMPSIIRSFNASNLQKVDGGYKIRFGGETSMPTDIIFRDETISAIAELFNSEKVERLKKEIAMLSTQCDRCKYYQEVK